MIPVDADKSKLYDRYYVTRHIDNFFPDDKCMEIIETQEKSGPNCIFPLNTSFRFDQQMFLGLCKFFCRATHNIHVQIITHNMHAQII